MRFAIRTFFPDGSSKKSGNYTRLEAEQKKIDLMKMTENEDHEYYVVPLKEGRK